MSSHYNDNWILYDGDCPFCRNYLRFNQLNKNIGPVMLINAREGGKEVDFVHSQNLSLNEGMVFKYKGRLYHGDECINLMALLSGNSNIFSRLMTWIFKSHTRAKILYPFLRTGRNLTLKLLRKSKIEEPCS